MNYCMELNCQEYMSYRRRTVLQPCGCVLCIDCSEGGDRCPICRAVIYAVLTANGKVDFEDLDDYDEEEEEEEEEEEDESSYDSSFVVSDE